MKKAKAAGIDLSALINEIETTLENNSARTTNRIFADADVNQKKRTFIQRIQQILKKYGVDGRVQIGLYFDTWSMNGGNYVSLELSSYGIFETDHDGRSESIELSKLSVDNLFDPKDIFCGLIKKLTDVALKNKFKINEFESALKSISQVSKEDNRMEKATKGCHESSE